MGATHDLARFMAETTAADLPASVLHEAKRDVINILGVSLYSSQDPSLRHLLDLFAAEGSNPRARVWGAGVRTSLQNAALANGYTAHLEDYDDTHFPTVLHPTAPTVPAAFAIGEATGASGRDVLAAVALGIEAACRLSLAVHPWHYDAGWHITGTFGVFGSAVAAGRLLGLDTDGMVTSFGIAGTQAAGVRETFGSMSKPFHAGRAAMAGVTAGLLAQSGFTSTATILEGRRGIVAVASSESDLSRATDNLGSHWELVNNGLKPYSCGVVAHPIIDACVELRGAGLDVDQISAIEVECHPLVVELINRPEPKVGLEGKFSIQHCVASGLIEGAAHPAQYSDATVADPRFAALRAKVKLNVHEDYEEEEGGIRLTMADGSSREMHVEHCTGSPKNPMTDARLADKFLALTTPSLGASRAQALLEQLWRLDEAANLNALDL